jgi:hypothetical protein
VTGPQTYHDASDGSIVDQIDRYRELDERDLMARSIATLKARGTYECPRTSSPTASASWTPAGAPGACSPR